MTTRASESDCAVLLKRVMRVSRVQLAYKHFVYHSLAALRLPVFERAVNNI